MNMASYMEIDAVIDPAETRRWIMRGLKSIQENHRGHPVDRLLTRGKPLFNQIARLASTVRLLPQREPFSAAIFLQSSYSGRC